MQVTGRYVWTVDEVAAYLRVSPRRVRAMARSGALPAFKWGKTWRFLAVCVEAIGTGVAPPARLPVLEIPEVLTSDDVAALMRCTRRAVQMNADGRAFRLGGELRFPRPRIVEVLASGLPAA